MKFSQAWADIASQNVILKITCLCLTVSTAILAITSSHLSLRAPLIIDRECFSKPVTVSSTEHTKAEVEAFVKISLSQRFDSRVPIVGEFLSDSEKMSKMQELKEFDRRNMTQTIVVNSISTKGQLAEIDADRLISVGTLKSVLAFPLKVTLESTDRTQANPYGLRLAKVELLKKETNKDEKD